jgi:hypothetical protein
MLPSPQGTVRKADALPSAPAYKKRAGSILSTNYSEHREATGDHQQIADAANTADTGMTSKLYFLLQNTWEF